MWQIISDFIGIFILGICEIIFARIVLDSSIKTSKITTAIILLISSLIFTLISTYSVGTIKTIMLYIIHMFEFQCLFKISYLKSMFLTFIYAIVLIIPDILSLLITTTIIGINKIEFYNEIAGTLLGNIIISLLFLITTLLLRKILKKIMKTEISNNEKIIILSILTLISIAIFFYRFIQKFSIDNNIIPYLISIGILIIILFSLIKQTLENNKLSNKYDKLLEFMTTYENEIENQRILRHEIKNEFRTIRAKICDNQENREIIEYIDEIVNDKYEMNKEKYAKFGYLPANGIKGLCYYKTQEAESKGIKVSLNISKRIKNSTIYSLNVKQQRDFGRIIGVFLDNAIEASNDTEEKKIGIEAYVNIEQEFKLIISNTYNNKIDKEKIGIESFSTKGKNRGHGLLLVKQLVNKNDIFKISTSLENNLYIQTIEIKKLGSSNLRGPSIK